MPLIRDEKSFGTDIVYGEMRPDDFVRTKDVSNKGEVDKVVKLDNTGTMTAGKVVINSLDVTDIAGNDSFLLHNTGAKKVIGASSEKVKEALGVMSQNDVQSMIDSSLSNLDLSGVMGGSSNSNSSNKSLTADDLALLQYIL